MALEDSYLLHNFTLKGLLRNGIVLWVTVTFKAPLWLICVISISSLSDLYVFHFVYHNRDLPALQEKEDLEETKEGLYVTRLHRPKRNIRQEIKFQ